MQAGTLLCRDWISSVLIALAMQMWFMKPVLTMVLVALVFCVIAAGCTETPPPPGTPGPAATTGPANHSSANGSPQAAGYPSTSLEIKEYVDRAASWAQENGKDAALAAFNNATGPFVTGDVYIYALDYSGKALALPFQPAMVGSDFLPIKDASGKYYTDIEIKLARGGGGYILYHYPYPSGNGTSTLKISYVRPVDSDYWIGAGVYTSEDRLVDMQLRQFVSDARAYALEHGRERALAGFNNASGPFILGELYIFAYDYNGTVLSWPYRPDEIGVNRTNVTDPVGSHHVQEFLSVAKAGGGMVDYYSVNPATNKTDLKISYVTDIDGSWMIGAGRYIEPGPFVLRG